MRLLAAAGIVLFTLAGCSPAYPKCETDAQCKEHGEVCVQGECKECATDASCKDGFVCEKNRCVPKPAAAAQPAEAADTGPKKCTTDNDCGAKQLCLRKVCVDITPELAECGFMRVHFDFNSVDLKPEDHGTLDRMARCVRANAKLHVTIEGNADERGTEEYNLQLSQRRAGAIAKYLQNLGASADQLETIGYGEERPACKQHDEACWEKNRRAGLKPSK